MYLVSSLLGQIVLLGEMLKSPPPLPPPSPPPSNRKKVVVVAISTSPQIVQSLRLLRQLRSQPLFLVHYCVTVNNYSPSSVRRTHFWTSRAPHTRIIFEHRISFHSSTIVTGSTFARNSAEKCGAN